MVPFIKKIFPDGRRFQLQNGPKLSSNYPKDVLSDCSINWWKTPAEGPDLNQIENVWGSIKYFLQHKYKPWVVGSLESGMKESWLGPKTLSYS